MMIGELLNISTLDPLLPTLLIATLCLCILSVITYYSLSPPGMCFGHLNEAPRHWTPLLRWF